LPANEVLERVADLISAGQAMLPQSAHRELDELSCRIREPVRLAVVGRVKAGKSTLVNALLGQRVAPTDVSECTRLVTWFRYGHPQRVDVELFDGTTVDAELTPEGTLPDELGVPVTKVRSLNCYLANEALKWVTLIDTPGIGSVHGEYSAATDRLLSVEHRSADAADRADAVIFLFNQVVMEDEMQALQLFKTGAESEESQSAASAVGILSKADQLGDGVQDPWGVALELADRYSDKFRDEVAMVVPVVGLIAETAESAVLTERDALHVTALAGMDHKAFERLLWSTDRFVSADAPVPESARERLLMMLDLYGVKRAVNFARDGATGATALRKRLSEISGIAEVKRTLDRYFHEQDHVLKARSALEIMRRLSYKEGGDPRALGDFRGQVEALKLDPVMHPIAELEVLHQCMTGRIRISEEMLAEVKRLLSPGTAARRLGITGEDRGDKEALVAAARDGMVRWRTFRVTEAGPSQGRLAQVVMRTYQILWKELQ
jgi:energy-coupling factor transporter ATP-binding protein EcfA2